jgi:hypothetical protein
MNARRVLVVLSGLFLLLGIAGLVFRSPDGSEPVVPIVLLVLGTAAVAFLAYLGTRS